MIIKKVTITTALMAVGVITSLGYAAVAQTNRPESAPSQSTPPLPNRPAPLPNQPLPNRPAPLPNQPLPNRPLPGSNSQLSALDNQFVIEAAHGGMAEVRLGQLALQRSTSPQVKQFAQRMIQEHTQANTELMRLMQLSGAEFDQAYMNEAGVNAHLESAAVYQRQAALGLDPDLKAFASRTLPRVQGHLEMAIRMTGYRFAQTGNTMPTSPTMNMPR